jgi:hypothetical protein
MADRIFKGRLIVTGDIAEQNRTVFPEASKHFEDPHEGGLQPFDLLIKVLDESPKVTISSDNIMLRGEDSWIKIDMNGDIELGTGAA